MKKFKNDSGILAVEASLVLFFLIFFMLFIWNFAGLFSAHNAVSHAAMQAGQSIAVDNMSRQKFLKNNENIAKAMDTFDDLINALFGEGTVNLSGMTMKFTSLGESAQEEKLKEYFYYFLGGDTESGKEVAKKMKIDPDTLKINVVSVNNSTGLVEFKVEYQVKFMFSVFGMEGLNLEQMVSFRLFGYEQ